MVNDALTDLPMEGYGAIFATVPGLGVCLSFAGIFAKAGKAGCKGISLFKWNYFGK